MLRRLLLASLASGFSASVMADERPAVRLAGIRIAEESVVRGQMPDTTPRPMPTGPSVLESRGAVPPPVIPGQPVSIGTPTAAQPVPTPAPNYPMPQPEPMLFTEGSPYLLPSTNSNSYKWWFSGEYLYWSTERPTLPPLVTTGPAASNGILGATGTTVLLGDGGFGNTGHNGYRLAGGYWFGCNQCRGIDFTFFQLADASETFAANSATYPVLARPFFNLNQNTQFSQLVASPGLATGSVAVALENSLWGIDTNWRRRWSCTPCARLDGLIGFRYVNFDESLVISENFARTPNSNTGIGVPNAASGVVVDQFSTENDFYGGQLGLQGELRRGRWFLNGSAKFGLGSMEQSVTISGSQQILLNNGTVNTVQGGLLALPGANIGTYSQSKFAFVPEVGVNLGFHFTPRLRVYAGYSFLYLSSVLRPADQIDTGLDVTRIPNFPVPGAVPLTTVRPTVPLRDSSLFVQGVNVGLSFTW